MNVNLKSLVGRLNDTCRSVLEDAAGLCLSRTNYDIEIEHLLMKFLERDDTDLHRICHHYEVNLDRLTKDVNTSLDRLKTGNTRTPGLSERIPRWVQDAWLKASIDFGAGRVRSGHMVLSLLQDSGSARIARDISKEFNHISVESLQKEFVEIVAASSLNGPVNRPGTPINSPKRPISGPLKRTVALAPLEFGKSIKLACVSNCVSPTVTVTLSIVTFDPERWNLPIILNGSGGTFFAPTRSPRVLAFGPLADRFSSISSSRRRSTN